MKLGEIDKMPGEQEKVDKIESLPVKTGELVDLQNLNSVQLDCILCSARGIHSLCHFHCFHPRTRQTLAKALFLVLFYHVLLNFLQRSKSSIDNKGLAGALFYGSFKSI